MYYRRRQRPRHPHVGEGADTEGRGRKPYAFRRHPLPQDEEELEAEEMTEEIDENIYQRALAAGESEKSARNKALRHLQGRTGLHREDRLPEREARGVQKPCVRERDDGDGEGDGGRGGPMIKEFFPKPSGTGSELFWSELFLFLRWVVGAIVVVLITWMLTAPKTPGAFA